MIIENYKEYLEEYELEVGIESIEMFLAFIHFELLENFFGEDLESEEKEIRNVLISFMKEVA